MGTLHLSLVSLLALSLACPVPGRAAQVEQDETAAAAPDSSISAQQELDRMDGRTPVPLLPMMAHHQKQNMRDHLVAVQEIVAATAANDFAAVESAAQRMGYSDQMAGCARTWEPARRDSRIRP